jgi:hypothetical protein
VFAVPKSIATSLESSPNFMSVWYQRRDGKNSERVPSVQACAPQNYKRQGQSYLGFLNFKLALTSFDVYYAKHRSVAAFSLCGIECEGNREY